MAEVASARSAYDRALQRLQSNDAPWPRHALPSLASGTLAFYAAAFSSQLVQHKLLKMSTGTRPAALPALVGAATVALGSWAGHLAGLGTASARSAVEDAWREKAPLERAARIGRAAARPLAEMTRPMKVFAGDLSRHERRERREAWMHAARICILGLLTYKTIFRSRFSSISPSSYTARGSFARASIPAPPNFNYATRSQRVRIERIGRRWGCHTCGSRMIFSNLGKDVPKFHGDHIPPVSVAKQLNDRWHRRMLGRKVTQRFYPQCRNCSNKQGGLLAKGISAGHRNLRSVGGGEESYFHGRRIRIGHLTGGAVAVATVANNDSGDDDASDLVESSRKRVLSIQLWLEDLGRGVKERVIQFWRDIS